MGKKLRLKKFQFEDDEDEIQGAKQRNSKPAMSSDDEEANEDLSLKIVEKALLLRASKLVPDTDVNMNGCGELSASNGSDGVGAIKAFPVFVKESDAGGVTSVASGSGVVAASKGGESGSKKVARRKKKKDKKLGTGEKNVVFTEGQTPETPKTVGQVDSVEQKNTEIVDNSVFKKLLRGPRYFDPPDSWGACFNCGEDGHNAVNCKSAKRRRPCFVCGSLEHNVKNCSKARDCFICKKGGHHAKDCPDKHAGVSSNSKVCLKCGDYGHDMVSCQNRYSDEDLKNIQCYICKEFGHLCCVNSTSNASIEVSCYKCGQIGHTGLACSRLRGEASGAASSSSCYRCGEEGHFARECTNAAKGGKRSRDSSTPKLRSQIEEMNHKGSKSAPHHLANGHKKKKPYFDAKYSTPQPKLQPHWNSGYNNGWMTQDPGNFHNSSSRRNHWNSPVTPTGWVHNIYSGYSGHYASPQPSSNMHGFHPGTPMSLGSNNAYQNRYSASRFGDYSNEGRRRNYGWW